LETAIDEDCLNSIFSVFQNPVEEAKGDFASSKRQSNCNRMRFNLRLI
jgi:hypothetical protein